MSRPGTNLSATHPPHHAHSQQLVAATVAKLADRGFPHDMSQMTGPTKTSNWLLKDYILCGDYPRGTKLTRLISEGVEHFVDLRQHSENYLAGRQGEDGLQYTHFDMADHVASAHQSALTDTALMLRGLIADCLLNNRMAYIHCTDGHTLTAVAMCGLLSIVYGVSGLKASAMAAQLHGARQDNENVHQLLVTPTQKAFVRSLGSDTSPYPIGLFSGGSSCSSMGGSRGGSPTQSAPPAPEYTQSAPNFLSYHAFTEASTSGAAGGSVSPLAGSTGAIGTDNSPHTRFEHTKGHGGGYTSINIFGGEEQSSATPPKRTGRASVPGMTPDYHRHTISGPTGSTSPQHVDPMAAMQSSSAAKVTAMEHRHSATPGTTPGSSARRSLPSRLDVFDARHTPQAKPLEQQRHQPHFETTGPGGGMTHLGGSQERERASARLRYEEEPLEEEEYERELVLPSQRSLSSSRRSPAHHEELASQPLPPYVLPHILVPKKEKDIIRGPNTVTNWVVRDQVLCGPAPHPNQKEFSHLVQQRFDVFVSLSEIDDSQFYWQPYEQRARHRVRCVHYPMFDGAPLSSVEHEKFFNFVMEIAELVLEGQKIYIHCKAGHGRTGMVVSTLLSILYKLPGMKAVNLCDSLHECRQETERARCPEQEQRTSIIAMLKTLGYPTPPLDE